MPSTYKTGRKSAGKAKAQPAPKELRGPNAVGIAVEGRDLLVAKLVKKGDKIRVAAVERHALGAPLESSRQRASLLEGILETDDREHANAIAGLSDEEAELALSDREKSPAGFEDNRSVLLSVLNRHCDRSTRLGLNIPESHLTYYSFEGDFGLKGKKLLQRLIEEVEIRQHDEVSPETLQYVRNENDTLLALNVSGGLPVLEEILDLRHHLNGSFPRLSVVEANETALANFVRANYALDEVEASAVLHVGRSSTRLLFFRRSSIVRVSDPVARGASSADLAEFLARRIQLEEDQHGVGHPGLILLSGRAHEAGLLEGLTRRFEGAQIEHVGSDLLDASLIEGGEAAITESAIPIALAWKALVTDHPRFLDVNFLPKEIRERQAGFKIAWHGFLVLALAPVLATLLAVGFQARQRELDQIKSAVALKSDGATNDTELATSLDNLRARNDLADRAISVLLELQANAPRWTPLLHEISTGAQGSRQIWVTQLSVGGRGYQLRGRATEDDAVSGFAEHFPGCRITEVTPTTIRNRTVYDFKLESDRPFAMAKDVQGEAARASDDAEGGRP